MSKHTPGPWKTVGHNLVGVNLGTAAAGVICQTASQPASFVFAVEVGSTEDEANRTLIAAAPDLLAVLSEFVTDVDAVYASPDLLADEWSDIAATYSKAQSLLAKMNLVVTKEPTQ